MRARIPHVFVLTLAAFALCSARSWAAPGAGTVVAPVTGLRGITDLGHAAATTPVALAVTLHYRNEAQLQQLVTLQSDPYSPIYRRFLTNEQFNASFAPTDADYRRVLSALGSAGFRVTQMYPNKTVIDAVGTVASANRFFGTDIHRVFQSGHGIRLANAVPARIPAQLAPLVYSVNGLSTLTVLRPAYAMVHPHPAGISPLVAGPPSPLYPELPFPAYVEMMPVDNTILRMTASGKSATYRFPRLSSARPCG